MYSQHYRKYPIDMQTRVSHFLHYESLIQVDFAVCHDRDVHAALQELHNLLAFSHQLCPAGFCTRILLQSSQVSVFKAEIDLF